MLLTMNYEISVHLFPHSLPSNNHLHIVNRDAIESICILNRIISLKSSFHELRGQGMLCLIYHEWYFICISVYDIFNLTTT